MEVVQEQEESVKAILGILKYMIDLGLLNIINSAIYQGKQERDELALMIKKVNQSGRKVLIDLDDGRGGQQTVTFSLLLNYKQNVLKMYENRKTLKEKLGKTK